MLRKRILEAELNPHAGSGLCSNFKSIIKRSKMMLYPHDGLRDVESSSLAVNRRDWQFFTHMSLWLARFHSFPVKDALSYVLHRDNLIKCTLHIK